MALIQTTIPQMKTVVEELRSDNAQFKTKVDELNTSEGKLNSSWEGPANDAFHTAFLNDYNQMNTFYQTMEQFILVLESSIGRYVQAESKNTDMASTRKY